MNANPLFRAHALAILLALASPAAPALAQDINLLPKYGLAPKNDAQKAADERFIAAIDAQYKGDRKKAAQDVADRGWKALRQGNQADAMRRFNQAWLLDKASGSALWGMAVLEASRGRTEAALKLFAEAEPSMGADLHFAVDHARALGAAGAETRNDKFLQEAFTRFERIHARDPQHTLNLQNWAITYFYVGKYADAWKKVALAEATPRAAEIDREFIAALQAKMPRPATAPKR